MLEAKMEAHFEKLAAGMIDEALADIKELYNDPQMTDVVRFDMAQYFYQLGFVTEAIEIAQELYMNYPNENELLLFLAELYMEGTNEDEALALLSEVTTTAGEDYIRAILLASEIHLMQGLYEVAEYKIKQALQHYPNEKILHSALGEVFYQQENYPLAILSYQKGSEISTYAKMADCYAHIGEFEESLHYYEKATTTEVSNVDLLFGYGFVAFQLKKWDLAISKFQQVVEHDPFYSSVYPLLIDAHMKETQYSEAMKWIEIGLKYDQTNPHLFYLKGELLMKEQKLIEAQIAFEESLGIDDTYVLSLEKLSQLVMKEDKWDVALELLDRLVEIIPERGDLYTRKGTIYEEMEEWNKAEDCYREAIYIDDRDTEALNRLAFFLRDEGKIEEAIALWKKSLEVSPEQWDIEEILQQYK